jgi:preprotein translocase subunit SecG
MTFLAINWLNISIDLLLVIFVIVCLLMTLVILMQRPKQEGLGAAFGGGVTDQVFGARTTNVLQKGTVYLGSMFFILSLLLAVLIGQKNRTTSTVTEADTAPKVEETKPAAVEVAPKSLSEELPPADPTPIQTPAPAEVPADASTPPAEPAPVAPVEEATPAGETAPVAPPVEETTPEAPPAAPEGEASGAEKPGE